MKPRLLVILGPTASGKSTLAVTLAHRFDGEVISADSRQVYRGLDIGTGKITKQEMGGTPHHLLDVANSKDTFTAADFKHHAIQAITEITSRKKLPILAGGTGFYIQAIVDDLTLPHVPPHPERREELEGKSAEELHTLLASLDPARAASIEKENPRRLIRAIEIAEALGHVPQLDTLPPQDYRESPYDVIQIGLDIPHDTLEEHIRKRVKERLKQGWRDEVKQLMAAGVPRKRFKEFGLGYMVLLEKPDCSEEELVSAITTAELHYAKRQVRWFKRDTRILWFSPSDYEKVLRTIQNRWS